MNRPPWFWNAGDAKPLSAAWHSRVCWGRAHRVLPGFDARAAKLQAEDQCHKQPCAAIAGEMESFDRSGEETVHTGPYGALPILIFSQDPVKATSDGEPAEIAKAWNQMQEDLKRLSTRSRRIIARGSTHYIQLDARGADRKGSGTLPRTDSRYSARASGLWIDNDRIITACHWPCQARVGIFTHIAERS